MDYVFDIGMPQRKIIYNWRSYGGGGVLLVSTPPKIFENLKL